MLEIDFLFVPDFLHSGSFFDFAPATALESVDSSRFNYIQCCTRKAQAEPPAATTKDW